jgi:hypothetical protein
MSSTVLFYGCLERKPHFPRAGVPGSIATVSEGYGCGRFGGRDPLRGPMDVHVSSPPAHVAGGPGRFAHIVKCAGNRHPVNSVPLISALESGSL